MKKRNEMWLEYSWNGREEVLLILPSDDDDEDYSNFSSLAVSPEK